MVKTIIFDMDGVIFNTENIWASADLNANKLFNIKIDPKFRESFCGKSELEIKDELRQMFPNLDVDLYRKTIHEYVHQKIDEGEFEIKAGFIELINYLKNNNYQIALATSSDKLRINKLFKLKKLDLNIFDYIVCADDVGKRSKPDPYIFNLVSNHFNIDSKDIIVLEDSINGIMAAHAGGFIPIMVKDLIEPNDFCIKNCKKIFNDLFEVIEYLKK